MEISQFQELKVKDPSREQTLVNPSSPAPKVEMTSPTQSQSSVRRLKGRAEFYALLDDVERLINEGYTVASIFRAYKWRLSIGYAQFNKYVDEFIRSKPDENEGTESGTPYYNPNFSYYVGRYDALKPEE